MIYLSELIALISALKSMWPIQQSNVQIELTQKTVLSCYCLKKSAYQNIKQIKIDIRLIYCDPPMVKLLHFSI